MMFVILAYDVNAKRVAKIRKTAEKYLQPVQKSVFEGFLTEHALVSLQTELRRNIDCNEDAILLYKQAYDGGLVKCMLGKHASIEGSIL